MNDSEYRKQKQRVLKAFNKWRAPTGINEWIVYHTWHRDGTAGKDTALQGEDDRDTAARAVVRWQYLHVNFHWNLTSLVEHDDDELDRIVRHEIAHVLINEMRMWGPPGHRDEQARDEAMCHEERVVTKLASVLLWCQAAGEKRARRAPRKRN